MVNKYTKDIKINENKAKTIINRLGQKSISLPRISDDKRLRGYPGLAGTDSKIAKYIAGGNVKTLITSNMKI